MIVSIHQPNYLPWLGFFNKIKQSDLFILFDDVQIVAINDITPEIESLCYLLKYDSFYGRFKEELNIDKHEFIKKIKTKINNSEIQLCSHQNQSRNLFMYVILIVSVL